MKVSILLSALLGTAALAAPLDTTPVDAPVLNARTIPAFDPNQESPLEARSAPGAPPSGGNGAPRLPPAGPIDTNSFLPSEQFSAELLRVHNEARAAHGASALSWSAELASFAASKTPSCTFQHTQGLQAAGVGENILIGQGTPASMAQSLWYDNELRQYNFARQGFSGATGHMTQMVWKATTEVGCAARKCPNGTFVKCNYRAPGNMLGSFESNVSPPNRAVAPYPNQPPNQGQNRNQNQGGNRGNQNQGNRGGSRTQSNNGGYRSRPYTYTYTYTRSRAGNRQYRNN
ncbi:hypothetical protein TWF696_006909 [Orbilia brochopaga]|uniref:SCP domain-containing protein n=1 Tax=Orbilia brochopaga TaxID=3140254 RepID=A0AAV9UQP5_9PEZI